MTRAALFAVLAVAAVVIPNVWLRDAFGAPTTAPDVIASVCLAYLYGGALGAILRPVVLAMLRPRNG